MIIITEYIDNLNHLDGKICKRTSCLRCQRLLSVSYISLNKETRCVSAHGRIYDRISLAGSITGVT